MKRVILSGFLIIALGACSQKSETPLADACARDPKACVTVTPNTPPRQGDVPVQQP